MKRFWWKRITSCALCLWFGTQAGLGVASTNLSIATGPLKLNLDVPTHRWMITDARTQCRWESAATPWMQLLEASQTGNSCITVRLKDAGSGVEYKCAVSLETDGVAVFTLSGDTNRVCGEISYPGELRTDWEQGSLIFCNRSCGQIIPQKEKYPVLKFAVYGNLGLDMPWIGVVDLQRGEGLMVLFETPCDAMTELRPDAAGNYWPAPAWFPVLGKFGYERKVSYRFSAQGGYVALAKMYREIARRAGLLKTLAEKTRERPPVERLKGAVRIWGSKELSMALELPAFGISHAILDVGGDSNALERVNDMGFLTHEYDSYCDILEGHGKIAFQRNDITNNSCMNADGTLHLGWRTLEGLQFYYLSSAKALEAAKTYAPGRLATHPFNARFLDVTSAVDLMEDYSPRHTLDRRQDMRNRQQLNAYFTDGLKLVVGAEHCKAWNVPNVDYSEGQASGPFWWDMPAGHLVAPTNRSVLTANYLKYGDNWQFKIPLWELVFHDCIASTWYWGDSSGYYYEIAPEICDRKDLWNILSGTVPLVWASNVKPDQNLDYGWNRHRDRILEAYRNTCKFHEIVGFDELTEHEFLSADHAVQRTHFSSRAVSVVNFSDDPRPYETGNGKVILAPRGFWVKAPGFKESRLLEDGQTVTRLEAKDYFSYACSQRRQIGPVEVQGRVTLFRVSEKTWHILAETQGDCLIDLHQFPGFSAEAKVAKIELSELGQSLQSARTLPTVAVADRLIIPAGTGMRLLRLQLRTSDGQLVSWTSH